MLSRAPIAWVEHKVIDVAMITDLTVDQTDISEEFKAGKVPQIGKAKLMEHSRRNIKILKIK